MAGWRACEPRPRQRHVRAGHLGRRFIRALQCIDATGGPQAGEHTFYRGAALAQYDDQTRLALARLEGRIDTERASAVWDAALTATWDGPPVWFHGDIASGNLLVSEGRLAAVIDFGTSGVGDPACDLAIAWTLFSGDSREAFHDSVRQGTGTWARARGWTLWKALIELARMTDTNEQAATVNRQIVDDVLTDHEAAGRLPGTGTTGRIGPRRAGGRHGG